MKTYQEEEYLNWLKVRTNIYAQMRNVQRMKQQKGKTQAQ